MENGIEPITVVATRQERANGVRGPNSPQFSNYEPINRNEGYSFINNQSFPSQAAPHQNSNYGLNVSAPRWQLNKK